MIERQTINGREAIIAYLDPAFNPTSKAAASLVKITIPEDGQVIFLSTGVEPGSVQPPYALRRASRRERTPHDKAIHDFALAMDAAEKPRAILKKRFGYDDRQIGSLTLAYNRRRKKLRGG